MAQTQASNYYYSRCFKDYKNINLVTWKTLLAGICFITLTWSASFSAEQISIRQSDHLQGCRVSNSEIHLHLQIITDLDQEGYILKHVWCWFVCVQDYTKNVSKIWTNLGVRIGRIGMGPMRNPLKFGVDFWLELNWELRIFYLFFFTNNLLLLCLFFSTIINFSYVEGVGGLIQLDLRGLLSIGRGTCSTKCIFLLMYFLVHTHLLLLRKPQLNY